MTGKEREIRGLKIRPLRKEAQAVVLEICLGIALFWLLGEFIIFLLPVPTFPSAAAFFIGAVFSTCSMTHIAYVTELTIDMHSQKEAAKYTISRYLIRMALMTAVILAVYFSKKLNVVALFIGLFGIKAGAYLQPLMHRFLEWVMKR